MSDRLEESNMNTTFSFRLMNIDDIDEVMNVEHQSFTLPWSREAFYNEIIQNKFAIYTVVEVDERVVGYCGVWVVTDQAHITNIAILPEYRGRKLGEALMRQIIDLSQEKGAEP